MCWDFARHGGTGRNEKGGTEAAAGKKVFHAAAFCCPNLLQKFRCIADTAAFTLAGDKMLSIAVCDDEILECSHMAKKIKGILEEMKVPCMISQFYNGKELLQAPEGFDIIFLDIMM